MAIILQENQEQLISNTEIEVEPNPFPDQQHTGFDGLQAFMLTVVIFLVAVFSQPILQLMTFLTKYVIIFGLIFLAVKYYAFS